MTVPRIFDGKDDREYRTGKHSKDDVRSAVVMSQTEHQSRDANSNASFTTELFEWPQASPLVDGGLDEWSRNAAHYDHFKHVVLSQIGTAQRLPGLQKNQVKSHRQYGDICAYQRKRYQSYRWQSK